MELDAKNLIKLSEDLGETATLLERGFKKQMNNLEKKATPEELKEATEMFDNLDVLKNTEQMKERMEEINKRFR